MFQSADRENKGRSKWNARMATVNETMLERIDRALARIEAASRGHPSQDGDVQQLLDSMQAEKRKHAALKGEISDRLNQAIDRVQGALEGAGTNE